MKRYIKGIVTVLLAIVMAISSFIVVSAEVTNEEINNNTNITFTAGDSDGTRAYQLVWRYKSSGGHMYKRRWNATLGAWYDPDWILVY